MRKTLQFLLAVLAACVAMGVAAQDYPSRPVRLIVPFPPGAATDLAARVVGQQLQQLTGQAFVVELLWPAFTEGPFLASIHRGAFYYRPCSGCLSQQVEMFSFFSKNCRVLN